MSRPQPPPDEYSAWEPGPGYRVEWVEANPERERTENGGKCRRTGCKRPAVWALLRRNGWWRYCDWHHYGRKFQDGKIFSRRAVAVDLVTEKSPDA